MNERVSHWVGRIGVGAEAAHEEFVARLSAPETARAFLAYGLTSYTLEQSGDKLHVAFTTKSPPDAIKFLRDKRRWPDCWEWQTADPAEFSGGDQRFAWRRD